jgi:hypothetical protein
VYKTELEKIPEFQGFSDFARTFKLSRGNNADEGESTIAGQFKVSKHITQHFQFIVISITVNHSHRRSFSLQTYFCHFFLSPRISSD